MKLSKKYTLAVQLMAELTNQPKRVSDLAQKLQTTTNFLQQISQDLHKKGLLDTVRGPGGGLVREGKPVTASEVYDAVERRVFITTNPVSTALRNTLETIIL